MYYGFVDLCLDRPSQILDKLFTNPPEYPKFDKLQNAEKVVDIKVKRYSYSFEIEANTDERFVRAV